MTTTITINKGWTCDWTKKLDNTNPNHNFEKNEKAPSRKKRARSQKKKKREGNALNFGVKFLGALNLYMPIPLPLMNKMKTVLQQ